MKHLNLTVLGVLLITAFQARAQDHPLLREILEEKFHPEYTNRDELPDASSAFKTWWNEETKMTEANSTNQSEAEPFIAVNPKNSQNLVMSFMQQVGSLAFPIYYSNDGGNTWQLSEFNAQRAVLDELGTGWQVAGGGDPVFAYDKNGKLYFSFIYLTAHFTNQKLWMQMYWAESEDGGKTFTMRKDQANLVGYGALTFSGTLDPSHGDGIYDRQWMSVDQTNGTYADRLYCSYVYFDSTDIANETGAIYVKYKDANDTAFLNKAVKISTNAVSQFGNIEVDGNGGVHVTYTDLIDGKIMHSFSLDGGQSFSTPVVIAKIESSGNTGAQQGDAEVPHDRANSATNLAVDQQGKAYVVWTDFQSQGVVGQLAYSTDKGKTWSTPFNISGLLDTAYGALMPTVATNAKGEVVVSWYQVDATDRSEYYVAISNDGGKSFSEINKVSRGYTDFSEYNEQSFFGDYNKAVFDDCYTYSVWSDGRDSKGPKLYLAKINYCSVGVPEISAINSQISISSIYPLPANHLVMVNYKMVTKGQLKLVDLTGKLIMERTLEMGENTIELDIRELPAGTYSVILYNDAEQIVKKIIKT